MYFCSRRREKRYRYLLKHLRRAQTPNGKLNNGDMIEAKENTSPQSPEDVTDSIAVPQRLMDHFNKQKDLEVHLYARRVENDKGVPNRLKIISVSCSTYVAIIFK